MKTLYEVMDGSSRDKEKLRKAGEILKAGGLVAFPTETVYGLGGDALNPESSRKIYAAKGRPSDNPLIVHICRLSDLEKIAWDPDGKGLKVARAFWPGPLTMILKKKETVPLETTGGLPTVAVRFPSHPVARGLIDAAGGFIAAPSANTSGKPSPTSARYVAEDMDGRIDMILDGGDVGIGLESTIVDLTGGRAHDPQTRLCDTGDAGRRFLAAFRWTVRSWIGDNGATAQGARNEIQPLCAEGRSRDCGGRTERVMEHINSAVRRGGGRREEDRSDWHG